MTTSSVQPAALLLAGLILGAGGPGAVANSKKDFGKECRGIMTAAKRGVPVPPVVRVEAHDAISEVLSENLRRLEDERSKLMSDCLLRTFEKCDRFDAAVKKGKRPDLAWEAEFAPCSDSPRGFGPRELTCACPLETRTVRLAPGQLRVIRVRRSDVGGALDTDIQVTDPAIGLLTLITRSGTAAEVQVLGAREGRTVGTVGTFGRPAWLSVAIEVAERYRTVIDEPQASEIGPESLRLTVGERERLTFEFKIQPERSVSIGSPGVLSADATGDHELELHARKPGRTTLLVRDGQSGKLLRWFEVQVTGESRF